jgi:hypothetical protein
LLRKFAYTYRRRISQDDEIVANSKVKVSYPALKFAEKSRKPGGLSRQAAIAAASAGVETLREQSLAGISEAANEIERILAAESTLGAGQTASILDAAARIAVLAETFGYTVLSSVTKSLCDLTEAFIAKGNPAKEPIAVHANSIRLVMPPRTVTQEDAERILGELSRILMFYGCTPREEVRLKALRKLGLPTGGRDQGSGTGGS